MKKYVVSVIDFEEENVDLVVEGVYSSMCNAINSMRKVFTELIENTKNNNYKNIKMTTKYDNDLLINEVDIYYDGNKRLFQINLSETFE